MKRVIIFDTTLRDGEQSPGASLNLNDKLTVARALEKLGVDVIEAGFPIASPGDFAAVREIAHQVRRPVIAGLARASEKDIRTCYQAIKFARRPRIHTFIATSDIHIKKKLQKTKEEVLKIAVEAVRLAKKLCPDVEFSAEDAGRSDFEYLVKVVEKVIEAGATTVNIPDTVGYTIPAEFAELIAGLKKRVSNIEKVTLSVHCHNDLGLAVANSLAAVAAGARQVECTINGVGERAGNASLEEVVMALNVRRNLFGLSTDIRTKEIYRTSRLVSTLMGIPVQPNKAIVGENAFAHEAGIHQDGILKDPKTYEIMTPDSVGVPESRLVLGKHSGRHAFNRRLEQLGYRLSKKQLEEAFAQFKILADKKKYVYDEDIITLIEQKMRSVPEIYSLNYLQTSSGSGIVPTATIRLKYKNQVIQEAACGDGPVDAAYRAIDKITRMKPQLLDYNLRALSGGKDAQGEVVVRLSVSGRTFVGQGISTDIIEASVRAYLNALNKIFINRQGKAPRSQVSL